MSTRYTAGYLKAAANEGYAIALLPWLGSSRSAQFQLHPLWSAILEHARVDLVDAKSLIKVRTILATDLRLFRHRSSVCLDVSTTNRLVLVPRRVSALPDEIRKTIRNAEEALGGSVTLAPAGSSMRANLNMAATGAALTAHDWPPIITRENSTMIEPIDRLTGPALAAFRCNRARNWPNDIEGFREMLPAHPSISARVIAPPKFAIKDLISRNADPWIAPFGTPLNELFASTSFLVVPDNPEEDPYPDELLQLLDWGGPPPLLDPKFRPSVMEAALYAPPEDIAEMALNAFSDKDCLADLEEARVDLIRHVLSPQSAVEHISDHIPFPGPMPITSQSQRLAPSRVLSLSTNGVGMGHLSRQLAIATRLAPDTETVFIGFSQAVHVVRRFGFVAEHLPFFDGVGLEPDYWNHHLAQELDAAVRFYKPQVLLLDANYPFQGLERLASLHPSLPMAWIRRAMWGDGRDLSAFDRADLFDSIIEPGELAASYDRGPTTEAGRQALTVGPIKLIEAWDQLDRAQAASQIGIDPQKLNVLILPGGQNNFEMTEFWDAVTAELKGWSGTSVVAATWAMTEKSYSWPDNVIQVEGFPFARWFRAFDFAISTAGYNSFAELIGLGLPAIFVPNENPLMDRQDLRAAYAERNGLGMRISSGDPSSVSVVLNLMRDPAHRGAISARLAEIPKSSGAEEAARHISLLARSAKAHHIHAWI